MILVTGATGFVGRNLVKRFSQKDLRCLSRTPTRQGTFIGDLNNLKSLKAATKGVSKVIHLAGVTKGDVWKVNLEGTKNLIKACAVNKVKKIIFVSSFDATLNSEYGRSKLEAEKIVKQSGIDYVILRPTVIYGYNDKRNLGKIFSFVKIGYVPVFDNFLLQPVFVDDVIEIIIRCLSPKIVNKTYYVAGSETFTLSQIASMTSKVFDKKIIKIHLPSLLAKLFGYTNKTCDISRMEKDLDFSPLSFSKGLEEIKNCT
jgi:nucleoside-diphosphate-sugar epimerase